MNSIAITLASLLLLAAVSANAQQAITITRRGTPPGPAASPGQQGAGASNFTGTVRVVPVFQAIAPGRATGSEVIFEPGARTAWHVHRAGQTLIVTAGVGRVPAVGRARRRDPPGRCRPHPT